MKTNIILAACTFFASLGTLTANATAPIQISCGEIGLGKSVTIFVSPLTRTVNIATILNGEHSSTSYGPSRGIYDSATLDFSGRDFLDSDIYIHGVYARILRINHYAAFTINLKKTDLGYQLSRLSSGYTIASEGPDNLEEENHSDFLGLPCTIVGW